MIMKLSLPSGDRKMIYSMSKVNEHTFNRIIYRNTSTEIRAIANFLKLIISFQ